jgi:hypothetical protein
MVSEKWNAPVRYRRPHDARVFSETFVRENDSPWKIVVFCSAAIATPILAGAGASDRLWGSVAPRGAVPGWTTRLVRQIMQWAVADESPAGRGIGTIRKTIP